MEKIWITQDGVNQLEAEMVKFVKVDGEYRFLVCTIGNMLKHSQAIDKDKGEKAEAAGTIFLGPDSWKLHDSYSTTLKIGCHDFHIAELGLLIQRPRVNEYGGKVE